ncbi:sensor histidine kinase [Comamonas sp. BIGb0124]|uniref:sensor histidine kinase n=1 Tax=Comamonas sp. BIGb0124 TaxID=2485130 RepID=UPI001F2B7A38|nr:sensor histidine kinase [Comamonas sp. BIGb0124]
MLIMGASVLWSLQYLRTQVDIAHDRALIGALRAIDYNTSTASGGLAVEQPYLLLEFFELTVEGTVYFRVATEDGLAEVGSPALPMPPDSLEPGVPQIYNALYFDEPVRVATLLREARPPIAGREGSHIIVQVAEGLEEREQFEAAMISRSVERDVLLVVISVLLLVAGVVITLRPLLRLREELDGRAPDDLAPVEATGLPSEVRPLVDSVNRLMARYAEMARTQRQFLDDASHQLRTPLAVLRTQMSYALREQDPVEMRAALDAMQNGLTRAERLTNQMLSLAKARDLSLAEGGLPTASVDLCALAEQVVRSMWPIARARRIDLGLDFATVSPEGGARVQAVEWLLQEALSNLVDNALRYTPPGGRVTVQVSDDGCNCRLTVEDSGGGMSADDLARAGTRFRRGAAGKHQPGAGLGLAIVQTIATLHGARLTLHNRPADAQGGAGGLNAVMVFGAPGEDARP